MTMKTCTIVLAGLLTANCVAAAPNSVTSPDGKITATVELNADGVPLYSVQLNGKDVIVPSSLGLVRGDQAFDVGLSLKNISAVQAIKDDYTMTAGKRKQCSYRANRRVVALANKNGKTLQVIFQVSNDGVAFRYAFPETSDKDVSVLHEKTAFAFAPTTVSWLTPILPAKTGWSGTQPSYEDHYLYEKPVGEPSPSSEGWCFPALFKTADGVWVLICDSDVDENYCATRLAKDSSDGIYRIAFPHKKEHRGIADPVAPRISMPFTSPWRVVIIGDNLNTLIGSTLMTDVATPCKLTNTDFIKPGKTAWHWLRYGDNSATLEYANAYLDFAVKMKWEYILIDANWDRSIGYEKMTAFVKKAKSHNIGVILWYNSNGQWNQAPQAPKDKMHEREVRRNEFTLLRKMGVVGVKVDFFGGDKQATMKLYLDTFKDAAEYGILVNCHGSTIPRGWQRTWPNLVTMEAIRGMEFCTFGQKDADRQSQHFCMAPFARNVIGSMDITPMVFNPKIRRVTLRTTLAFELALSIVFESSVQHFGLAPDEYTLMPDYVVSYLQEVPTVWDDTRLVDGYPGKFVVMARRSGDTWYIGGINGTGAKKAVTLDLSFLPEAATATMITDGPNRSFAKTRLANDSLRTLTVKMKANGGFAIVAN